MDVPLFSFLLFYLGWVAYNMAKVMKIPTEFFRLNPSLAILMVS